MNLRAIVLPFAAMVAAMASIQVGASLAQRLFPLVGAEGTTALRVVLATVILLVIRRPPLRGFNRMILAYGLALGVMNLLFYQSLKTIPLGVAVAVELTGPLVLAAVSRHGPWEILAVALSLAGLVLLAPIGHAGALDPVGLGFALAAGACWALYIVFGQKAGATNPAGAAPLGMLVAAAVTFPVGFAHAGIKLFDPALLPLAVVIAALSSALPYSLEMYALTRLPRATFGILMSVEPALAAVAGWLIVGQHLSLRQAGAIGFIVLASAAATVGLVSRWES